MDEIHDEGDNVTLTCSALGGPGNTLYIQKDGNNLTNTSTLQLTDISAPDDGGVYTCVAINAAGSGSASLILSISPVITLQPADVNAVSGQVVNITCNAAAFPEPVYNWVRDGGDIPVNTTGSNSSTLIFKPVAFGDQGVYSCNATSSGITVSSSPATLTSKYNRHAYTIIKNNHA